MANVFKAKQEQAKREKLLADCLKMASGGAGGRMRAEQAYAKGAGVSKEVAQRVLADGAAMASANFSGMFMRR